MSATHVITVAKRRQ